MADSEPSSRGFILHWPGEGAPASEVERTLRNESIWVVGQTTNPTAHYGMVLENLFARQLRPEVAEIEGIRDILAKGFQRSAFDRLRAVISISGEELGEVIRVTPRTLARRTTFKPDESERILRVASAFQRAIEVTGDLPAARRWFTSPKRALAEKTPLEYCDTDVGAQEVVNLLGRIEHGVFS